MRPAAEANPAVAVSRVRYIDGLRAVAVLSVVLFHAGKYVPIGGESPRLLKAFAATLALGYHGVDLFFVLSGYCLAYPTLARIARDGRADFDSARYLARRFARILPPYEIALAVFAVLLGFFALRGTTAPPDMLSPLDLGNVVRDAFLLDGGTTHVNQSFWSLALEFRWYFIFPLALALWIRRPRAFWLVAGACVLGSYATHAASADLAYLPSFLLGIVAVDLELRRPPITGAIVALFVVSLGAAFVFRLPAGVPVSVFWQLAIFAFVVLAGRIGPLRAALSVPALFEIGIASYSIYLVHQPLVAFVAKPLADRIGSPIVVVAVVSLVGIVGGLVFWFVVERPFTTVRTKTRLEAFLMPYFDGVFRMVQIPRRTVLVRPQPADSQ